MTKVIKIDPNEASYADLAPAADILLSGGLIVGPTQSFYALMALADKPDALERLSALKPGRKAERAYLLLIDQKLRSHSYAMEVSAQAEALMDKFWPGLLTLLMPGHTGLHGLLLGRAKTVGLRVEGLASTRRLIRMVDRGITGTSANPHRFPPPTTVDKVLEYFPGQVDLILDAGPTAGGLSSTVVDMAGPVPWIFRKGAIPIEEIAAVCPSVSA
ncbi:MAG: threonylcarbamoyl-AMP synthase [Deltaproteobacteria bacterium]|nr:threonylcarbamoyl-AMP synthase [Deltaproteobacteria bacterium]